MKNTENRLPAVCTRCGTPSLVSASATSRADRRGRGVDAQVDLVGAGPQRGQPGGHRDRVPGQRAGLVDRPGRGQPGHDLGPAAERRGRQAAAHHLAEGEQVGLDRIQPVPAGAG